MRLRVLGCSGGVGEELRTTSFLLDDDVLIDAGSGALDLTLEAMSRIDHVFVTHSHLDHILAVPLIVDTVGHLRTSPLTIHSSAATLKALRDHVFNNRIWPDFAALPRPDAPYVRFSEMQPDQTVTLPGGRRLTPLPANHAVPATGFLLEGPDCSLAFTGDTTTSDALWERLNQKGGLRYVIIETAFSNRDRGLAIASGHLCPIMLAEELRKFRGDAEVFITHLKPGDMETTMREVREAISGATPTMLRKGMVFDL